MSVAVALLPLLLYGVWMIRRVTRTSRTRSPSARAVGVVSRDGLEDDPLQWPVTTCFWTTLDERQLVRLLTDSAP